MNRYEPSIPRVAFGIAAVAMTTITLGLSVILPAKMDSDGRGPRIVTTSRMTTPASTGVGVGSAGIDAIAVHEPGLASVPCTSSNPSRKPEG